MKRVISIFLSIVVLACVELPAAAYNRIACYSDVVAYINNYPIPSYNFRGYTFIAAEDLQNYGFCTAWDSKDRVIRIFRNGENSIQPLPTFRTTDTLSGMEAFELMTTDVKVFMGEHFEWGIEGYADIAGKTLINIDNLSFFGRVEWVDWAKAMKVWIEDGLEIAGEAQWVPEKAKWRYDKSEGWGFFDSDFCAGRYWLSETADEVRATVWDIKNEWWEANLWGEKILCMETSDAILRFYEGYNGVFYLDNIQSNDPHLFFPRDIRLGDSYESVIAKFPVKKWVYSDAFKTMTGYIERENGVFVNPGRMTFGAMRLFETTYAATRSQENNGFAVHLMCGEFASDEGHYMTLYFENDVLTKVSLNT